MKETRSQRMLPEGVRSRIQRSPMPSYSSTVSKDIGKRASKCRIGIGYKYRIHALGSVVMNQIRSSVGSCSKTFFCLVDSRARLVHD